MRTQVIPCALLTNFRHDWAAEITLSSPAIEAVTLAPSAIGWPDAPNPFALPEVDRAEIVLVGAWWRQALAARHPELVDEVMDRLERCAGVLIGLDGSDEFALGFPPAAVERLAMVIKFQGVYRDRDLYNWLVGARYPEALWTEKARPRRPRYRDSDLEKLRLSVPAFLGDLPPFRRAARRREAGRASTIGRNMSPLERVARDVADSVAAQALSLARRGRRSREVHCVVALSHVQRVTTMRLLEGFSGTRGIVGDRAAMVSPGTSMAGSEYWDTQLPEAAWQELVDAATPYSRPSVGRLRYLLQLCRHRVAVAPTGWGELGLRHSDAWRTGAALVCQDVSHVETMFPIRDGDNVVFCRPDLSDLRLKVTKLLEDDDRRRRIADQGHRGFEAWAEHWREHLEAGVEAHLYEALGERSPRLQAGNDYADLRQSVHG